MQKHWRAPTLGPDDSTATASCPRCGRSEFVWACFDLSAVTAGPLAPFASLCGTCYGFLATAGRIDEEATLRQAGAPPATLALARARGPALAPSRTRGRGDASAQSTTPE